MKGGKGSFDLIMKNIRLLLEIQQNMQVSARVTVTAEDTNLGEAFDELRQMGFHSVGFSPLLRSINGKGVMSKESLIVMLENMITCGLNFDQNALTGKH